MLRIVPMNRELCHCLYQNWENDPAIYMDGQEFSTYHYDKATVDRRFDRQHILRKLGFQQSGEDRQFFYYQLKK